MYPLNTVLDLSIATALWFASRGEGKVRIHGEDIDYKSLAKIVLVGMGADEQLGGYSRHRVAYNRGGWVELLKEMQFDVDRISFRNLGNFKFNTQKKNKNKMK